MLRSERRNLNVAAQAKYIRHLNTFNDLSSFLFLYTNVNLIFIKQTSLHRVKNFWSIYTSYPYQDFCRVTRFSLTSIFGTTSISASAETQFLTQSPQSTFLHTISRKIIIIVIINQRSKFGLGRGVWQM